MNLRSLLEGEMILTKSAYSPISRRLDGLRILATRFRGRGLPKSRYDVWMANLGPSEQLLKSMHREKISWAVFSRRYRRELFEQSTPDRKNRTIKNHGQKFTLRLLQLLARKGRITVMCHCDEEQEHCHRHLLQKILRGKLTGR